MVRSLADRTFQLRLEVRDGREAGLPRGNARGAARYVRWREAEDHISTGRETAERKGWRTQLEAET